MEKTMIILRGCSGSGKTTFARSLDKEMDFIRCEADDFCYINGEYKWDASRIAETHKLCQQAVEFYMLNGENIVVSNTSTSEKELKPYLDLAEKYEYNVISLIVEKRHSGVNTHNVPETTLQKQEQKLRNSIKLL